MISSIYSPYIALLHPFASLIKNRSDFGDFNCKHREVPGAEMLLGTSIDRSTIIESVPLSAIQSRISLCRTIFTR